MKFILRLTLISFIFLISIKNSFAQQYTLTDFYKVDSIADLGKPKDALLLIAKINKQAKLDGNTALLIKSIIYRMKFQSFLEENAFDKILTDLRKDVDVAKQPAKSILQSLLAETFWKFYQQNQWKISQRTTIQGDIGGDINTWSTRRLIDETAKNYIASLKDYELLKTIKIDFLDNILAGDKYNRTFRPTLYDLLANRAIDVFTNTQIDLTQQENEQIDFNNSIWFADREIFLNTALPQSDSSSFYLKTIQIFKNLILLHSQNNNQDALADVDFLRMKYVARRNNQQQLFLDALSTLANRSIHTEIYAEILYLQAELYKNSQILSTEPKQNLIKAIEIANQAIKAYPKSMGAYNAKNLINQIELVQLNMQTKQNVITNQVTQLLLTYKNLDTIYFKLYKRPIEEQLDSKLNNKLSFMSFLEKTKHLKEWFVVLPKSNDYQSHTLVTKIDALPNGNYFLLSQNKKDNGKNTVFSYSSFMVSSLIVMNRFISPKQEYVITDPNGHPLKNVKIQQKQLKSNNSTQIGEQLITNENGCAYTDKTETVNTALISKDNDSLSLNIYNYYSRPRAAIEYKKTILFTDRPIYRPGQTIFYKGLLIDYKDDKNVILQQQKITVNFNDVNGKKIKAVDALTNDYGTFQGSFTIPVGSLNGLMRINTDYGSINVHVEEYKRPTFEVLFEKHNQQYKLNDSIKVLGNALAFSGYTVNKAKVAYRIYRRAIYDFKIFNSSLYLENYGSGVFNRQQIGFGKTATTIDGKFEISFFAKSKEEKLNYSFEVEITITDLNGETKTKTTTINVGRNNIVLNVNNKSIHFLSSSTDSISFSVTNLNNIPIKASVNAEWLLLSPPNKITSKSQFNAENSTISKDDFIKCFPNQDYDNKLDITKWPIQKSVYNQTYSIDKGIGSFKIKDKDLAPGYYRVKFNANNFLNDTVSIERYITIYGKAATNIKTSAEWIVPEKVTINPQESAIFRIAGLTKNSRAYYEVYYQNDIAEKVWLNISPKQTILNIVPKANYKDGFAVQFTMVSDGIIYNSLQQVFIQDPKKQLEIKFLTFRNKLQSGENESWKLQISNKSGEKEMAEMVATLYDASLDDFKQMNWNNPLRNPFNYHQYTWRYHTNEISYGSDIWFLRTNLNYNKLVRQYEGLSLLGYNYYGGYNSGYRNYKQNTEKLLNKGISPAAQNQLTILAKGNLVYGIVLDKNGNVISGASIKTSKLSTITNQLGIYTINAQVGEELSLTYLGYQTAIIKIGQQKRIDINLNEDNNILNEVVVTAAGQSIKRDTLSYSAPTRSVHEIGPNNVSIRLRGSNGLEGNIPGVVLEDNKVYNFMSMESYDPKTGIELVNGKPIFRTANIVARSNFKETAFFYPELKTNENGEIKIDFTIPQSLTRYKMMGFAHTKDLKTATITNELITQKQLAITANAPRFFREADTISFSAKLNNISGKNLTGNALLELSDALTGKKIQILVNKDEHNHSFELSSNANVILKWNLIIPSGIRAITYKVIAQSENFSDGEEMTIPVLPNSILVTESMPINVRGNTDKTFKMEKLINFGSSKTRRNQALTFEFTSNPIWYAVQALPYLMEYPYECSEQTFSRFYANSFASGIINASPRIKTVFEQWKNVTNGEGLLSNLEKNLELKSILLEETPWVRNAINETERKKRLSILFDANRMTYELKANFEQLEKMQLADGSFPWFAGMAADRYITQHIVLGIGQLKKLKLIDDKTYPTLNIMLNKAIVYLDAALVKDHKDELAGKRFDYLPLHYLFARSYTNQINDNPDFVKAKDYYLKRITSNWKTFNIYQLGQAALVLSRNGNKVEPPKIITLLKQTAQQSDEMGMYWANNGNGWWWYQSPIETQSLLIEAFDEVATDSKSVEEMKIWLLKNKQTNNWKTTKATAAACYALLMKGYDLLAENTEPEILIGNKNLAQLGFADIQKDAGTGYQKVNISAANVTPEMGKVEVKNNNKTIAWGALYWQYFEQLDKITSANTGVKIKKQLFLQSASSKGNILTPLTATTVLTPGDQVKVRIEIYSNRDMEYIHLKDMRSSGLEPVNIISKYKYQDGLGYYESTKDASTNFFINYLRKGTYVFEYELRVTHAGNFSNGITSLQSMYSPEFTTYTEGTRLNVQ